MLPLRKLGKSDLMVSPIGLGCWQFSKGKGLGGHYWPALQDEEIEQIVRLSLEGGVNWFDTAESYGMGESEKALSLALQKIGKSAEEVIIATKWMPFLRTAKSITKTIDMRIHHLSSYHLDLYQIHHPLSFSSVETEMKAMIELVKNKKIRFIGLSNYSAKKMRTAQEELSKHGLNLISNQVRYSLLNRKIETNGILNTALELGVSIIAYSPLAQGLLSGKFHDSPDRRQPYGYRKYMSAFKPKGLEKTRPVINAVKGLAEKHQVTPSQIALNWVIQFQGDTVVAIPGATKPEQAKDNVGAMRFKLTQDELDYLDEVSRAFRN
ncbi:aldo/keto reductase [candidate division WOR-1 bacterium DG_54_3]|uniref:Aldo/keto reductase n=1 Tax=candidate division WOR-1 bacterium DG_54_3 TaxID=1703775 RepID=A0A0S7XT40_UNCSA|nr:MAG: aldo/keto reductase [candidate division WOR-1 bacterium DG_54_3]